MLQDAVLPLVSFLSPLAIRLRCHGTHQHFSKPQQIPTSRRSLIAIFSLASGLHYDEHRPSSERSFAMSLLMVMLLAALLPFPLLVGVLTIERIRDGRRTTSRPPRSACHVSA